MPTQLNERIQLIMHFKKLNATQFAEEVGVQRSSISHLITGRNKPSLDFIQKLTEAFPEIDLHWLIHGKGQMQLGKESSSRTETDTLVTKNNRNTNVTPPGSTTKNEGSEEINEPKKGKQLEGSESGLASQKAKLIKVVLFYENGSFEEYNPNTGMPPSLLF